MTLNAVAHHLPMAMFIGGGLLLNGLHNPAGPN
jgi:hypothetical protein